MSKLKVSGNASGTGVITIEAPNTNTDRAITLPDSAGELINIAPSTSGNVLTSDGTDWTSAAGGADTSLSNLSATGENKVAQAWCTFGQNGTQAIKDSHNISSISDIGVGMTDISIDVNMANVNYSVTGSAIGSAHASYACYLCNSSNSAVNSVGSFGIQSRNGANGGIYDMPHCNVVVFGD